MARMRSAPTLVEVIVILAVSAVLFILLTFTINRVQKSLAETPPSPPAPGCVHPGVDVKRTDSLLKTKKTSPVNMLSETDAL
jgi:hypothetical protein